MFELRPYQEACISKIMELFYTDPEILIQASTGAGKTIIFCELIKRLLKKWPHLRICIVAHRQVLVEQARDKMLATWPDAPIGIACASVTSKANVNLPVTIGSIQTLAGKINVTEKFHLIIIDECHRVPPMNTKNQYSTYIKTMRQYNPKLKIVGFTATPFRLGHGYIFGKVCKPGNENLFTALHFRSGIAELQAKGFLAPFKAKEVKNIEKELSSIGKQGGDYSLNEMSDELSKDIHTGSALKALRDYAQDRKHIVCFATKIDHAEKLFDIFTKHWACGIVHSKLPKNDRKQTFEDFDTGKIRIIINVGILTEGWDSPHVDCILDCAPTLSPAKFIQKYGRGFRVEAGKIYLLILDLVNNFRTHGHPDKPYIQIPNGKPAEKLVQRSKICPFCNEVLPLGTRECPECGNLLVEDRKEINGKVEMRDINFEPVIRKAKIVDYSFAEFKSRAGSMMNKLSLKCSFNGGLMSFPVNVFFDFEGNGKGYAKRDWSKLVGTQIPGSVSEAVDRGGELLMSLPDEIMVIQKGKWWNVHKWEVPTGAT